MTIMRCPRCKKQREVRAVGSATAITHMVERKYKCNECGLTFEKPVGIWRRNRALHRTRPSRQIIELRIKTGK